MKEKLRAALENASEGTPKVPVSETEPKLK